MKSKKGKNDVLFLILVVALGSFLLLVFPERRSCVYKSTLKFFIEMITVMPAVVVLMGLFSEFVSKDIVMKYLSKKAGFKSVLFGIFLGSLPTGPLYVAFPVANLLLEKGARVSCIVAFLSSWACIKIPQEMVEIQFLGFKFMILRLSLTIVFVSLMSFYIEYKVVEGKKER